MTPPHSPSLLLPPGTRRTLQLKIINEGLFLRDWDGHGSRLFYRALLRCGWSWRGLAFLYRRHRFFFFFAFGSWLYWEYLIDLLVGKRGEESNVKFNVSPLWQSGIINWGGIVTRGRALIK